MNGSAPVASFQYNPFLQFRSPFLLSCPSALIDAQKVKRATTAGWPKEKSLAQFLCSLPFHCKSNRHSRSALLSSDRSYGFGYSSESVLSPFVFEDNAHCLQRRELKESLNKITSQKEIRPFRGADLILRKEIKKAALLTL